MLSAKGVSICKAIMVCSTPRLYCENSRRYSFAPRTPEAHAHNARSLVLCRTVCSVRNANAEVGINTGITKWFSHTV